jgi:hypothetical protein
MTHDASNERWSDLVDLREDLESDNTVLPMRISGVDGSRRAASPRALKFAQALAFNAGWSGISEARRRHNDLAA